MGVYKSRGDKGTRPPAFGAGDANTNCTPTFRHVSKYKRQIFCHLMRFQVLNMHQIRLRPGLRLGPRWGSSRWGTPSPLPLPARYLQRLVLCAFGVSVHIPFPHNSRQNYAYGYFSRLLSGLLLTAVSEAPYECDYLLTQ